MSGLACLRLPRCFRGFDRDGDGGGRAYTVALLGDRHRSLVVGAVTTVVVIVAIVLIAGTVPDLVTRAPLVFASLAVGDTVRSRRALRAAAEERAERQEREREQEGRRRAVEERLRIARELHDTLAHSLVAINVRTSAVLDLDDSQDPSGALRDVKEASAAALRDLRATLSLLREQDDAAPTAPAFDLAGASRARRSGPFRGPSRRPRCPGGWRRHTVGDQRSGFPHRARGAEPTRSVTRTPRARTSASGRARTSRRRGHRRRSVQRWGSEPGVWSARHGRARGRGGRPCRRRSAR